MSIAIKVGSLVQNGVTGLVSLSAYLTAAARYETFESNRGGTGLGGGTDYQVTAGKTLYITKIIYFSPVANCEGFIIGYGDDGVAEGAAAPTNPVGLTPMYGLSSIVARQLNEVNVFLIVPAQKFPYAYSIANVSSIIIEGYEV